MDEGRKQKELIFKEGFLLRHYGKNSFSIKHPFNKTCVEYYVLKRGSLDCYKNQKCISLKRSYPLAIIEQVKIDHCPDTKFSVILTCQPILILEASDVNAQQEWVQELTTGANRWKCLQKSSKGSTAFEAAPSEELFNNLYPSQYLPRHVCSSDATLKVLGECSMIKYARGGKTIPHERIFKVDKNVLHIMWKKSRHSSNYRFECSVPFSETTEVRCGQQTRNFHIFPYVEVDKQSFSLIFQRDTGEWNGLDSLDLICDSVLSFDHWKQALQILIYGKEEQLPLRDAQKICDPMEIYLKRHWSILTQQPTISLDICLNFMHRFNENIGKRELRNFIKNLSRDQFCSDQLNLEFFFFLFNLFYRHQRLYEYFEKYAKSFLDLGMTPQEFMTFLKTEQKVNTITVATVSKLIEYHDRNNWVFKRFSAGDDPSAYQASANLLSFHGFISFLRSADNSIIKEDMKQDFNQPLSNYFINSSHNTYLTGHQLKGLSSCEAYVYALQQGCRCLEIDCWDGPEEPIVTHGMTLTTRIRLRDVLETIKVYAFHTSPYPVILSLENHCSEEQQYIMADLFEEIFGKMIATENLCQDNTLPSPEQLKHKIILKGNLKIKKKTLMEKTVRKLSRHAGMQKSRLKSEDGFGSPVTTKQRISVTSCHVDDTTDEKVSEDESVQIPLAEVMGNLIVYCRTVPYKRSDISQHCCEMHSFNETTINVLGERFPLDILYLSRCKLLRTYPRGSRVDSSNYNPMFHWKLGVQMAAINIQKPDMGSHINAGFFLKSFGSGYVLKPWSLTNRDCFYHPHMNRNPIGENMLTLHVEILCGQFVDRNVFLNLPVAVELETIGIDTDCGTLTTEATSENVLNPVWEKHSHNFHVAMPSLCLLYVKVFAVGRNSRLVYQNCLPVDAIKPGLRYLPLKTSTGVARAENGLFVKLDIEISPDKIRHQTELNVSTNTRNTRSRLQTI